MTSDKLHDDAIAALDEYADDFQSMVRELNECTQRFQDDYQRILDKYRNTANRMRATTQHL